MMPMCLHTISSIGTFRSVAEDLPAPPDPDTASDRAMTALGALCSSLLECRLVLAALPGEVDMIFDDLEAQLAAAQMEARQTFRAASLLRQGADLDPRWGERASRPKAVFARHGAAVKKGATQVVPHLSDADEFFDVLNDPGRPDLAQDLPRGDRPKCPAVAADDSQPCNRTALYLGKGRWAPLCWAHSGPADRDLYRRNQQEDSNRYEDRDERVLVLGRAVMDQWIKAYEVQPASEDGDSDTAKSSQP
jgi:hypothetical protein